MITKEQFREAYIQTFKEMKAENPNRDYIKDDYGWLNTATGADIERCVDKMIASFAEPNMKKSDYFKYNPAMKRAAKKLGIKTSPEMREVASKWSE